MANQLQAAAMRALSKMPYSLASKELPVVAVPGAPISIYSSPARASMESGNPKSPIFVEDTQDWINPDYTPQLLRHEMTHQVQNNWPEKIRQALPPINPKDPYNYGGVEGLKKIGGDPLQLSMEQQAAIEQEMQAMEQNGSKIDPIYRIFDRKLGEIPLSVMMPTDPKQKGINTTPRAPGLPLTPVQGLQKLYAKEVIPVKSGSGDTQSRYVELPNGAYMEWPEGVSAAEFKAKAQQVMGGPRAGTAHPELGGRGPVDVGMADRAMAGIENVGIGAAKGIGSMLNEAGKATPFGSPLNAQQEKKYLVPATTAQKVGKGLANVGSFLLPGLGEEAMGAKLLETVPALGEGAAGVLGRLGTQAGGAALLNRLQGGTAKSGAAAGLLGGGLGEGMRLLAPVAAETAMGVRGIDRLYGRIPGKAILEDTKGIRPMTVAKSARETIDRLTPELEEKATMASERGARGSLGPARQSVASTIQKHEMNRAMESARELDPLKQRLNTDALTGLPLAEKQTPLGLMKMKRGLNEDFIGKWSPDQPPGLRTSAKTAYGLINREMHGAAPETIDLDRRISSLIPVAKRAEAKAVNASTLQRLAGRMGAHTGALTGATIGALGGYGAGGGKGALEYGLLGLVAPEVLASPTLQMGLARSLYSTALPRLGTGAGLAIQQRTQGK